MGSLTDVSLVVPTVGRDSLRALLGSLADAGGPLPAAVHVVDDRPPTATDGQALLSDALPHAWQQRIEVHHSGGRGPAAARNRGWLAAGTAWVAFLDDDVRVDHGWLAALADDLHDLPSDVAGSQGRIDVPLPADRRPTDWERDVAGLAQARWVTADMAYRRDALAEVGGFDEGFPRAFREDADLALRLRERGWRLRVGDRQVVHPVGPSGWWTSVRRQAGNADDARMWLRHGHGWRRRAEVGPGRRRRHAAVVAAGSCALAAAASGRRGLAALLGAGWLAGTGEFAWARIRPGPRTPTEIARMLTTSAALPPVAIGWWLRGLAAALRGGHHGADASPQVQAVLFDRDGTLVRDVAYNGDPDLVEPLPGVAEALARLRQAGVATAVVSNQSGVARGTLTLDDVAAVNARVEELLGPLGPWLCCPHGPDEGCGCRKPRGGLVRAAAEALGVEPSACVVVGDIGADVDAAAAAGARSVLVPGEATRAEEVTRASAVAGSVREAVAGILEGRW